MKKGKSCTLKGYRNFKCSYGTVDAKNLKSIYINVQSWVKPKKYSDNWERVVSLFHKRIKNFINDILNQFIYENKFIVDLDLRSSGISIDKKSFMNLEITLFVKGDHDFKSTKIKNSVKEIVDSIQKEIMRNNDIFSFHLTKNDKKAKIEVS